jgi:hypothetical protein
MRTSIRRWAHVSLGKGPGGGWCKRSSSIDLFAKGCHKLTSRLQDFVLRLLKRLLRPPCYGCDFYFRAPRRGRFPVFARFPAVSHTLSLLPYPYVSLLVVFVIVNSKSLQVYPSVPLLTRNPPFPPFRPFYSRSCTRVTTLLRITHRHISSSPLLPS